MNPDQLARLPKYAQDEFLALNREIERLTKITEGGPDDSNTAIVRWTRSASVSRQPLEPGARVQFTPDLYVPDLYVEVYVDANRGVVARSGGSNYLSVRPRSSNVVELRPVTDV